MTYTLTLSEVALSYHPTRGDILQVIDNHHAPRIHTTSNCQRNTASHYFSLISLVLSLSLQHVCSFPNPRTIQTCQQQHAGPPANKERVGRKQNSRPRHVMFGSMKKRPKLLREKGEPTRISIHCNDPRHRVLPPPPTRFT